MSPSLSPLPPVNYRCRPRLGCCAPVPVPVRPQHVVVISCRRRDRFWRGAGVAIPVFSLRTQQSVGAGEFLDLLPLIDLADR